MFTNFKNEEGVIIDFNDSVFLATLVKKYREETELSETAIFHLVNLENKLAKLN